MKLYGAPLSNYFNMVRHALLEKEIAFELISTRPSQEDIFLAKSPMGKVPVLETGQGTLTETSVILEYLEEAYGGVRLLPHDAFARAKVRQLMKVQELYIETPAHALIGALFNRDVPVHARETSQTDARKGLAALARLVQFNPWICGSTLSFADIFVFYSFTLSNRLTLLVYDWDMLQEVPGLEQWYQAFAARGVTQQVMADQQAASDALAARLRS